MTYSKHLGWVFSCGLFVSSFGATSYAGYDPEDYVRDAYKSRRHHIKHWYDQSRDTLNHQHRQARADLDRQYRATRHLPPHVREQARREIRYARKNLERDFDTRRDVVRDEYRRRRDHAKYQYDSRRRALEYSPQTDRYCRPPAAFGYSDFYGQGHQPGSPVYRGHHDASFWERALAGLLLGIDGR